MSFLARLFKLVLLELEQIQLLLNQFLFLRGFTVLIGDVEANYIGVSQDLAALDNGFSALIQKHKFLNRVILFLRKVSDGALIDLLLVDANLF